MWQVGQVLISVADATKLLGYKSRNSVYRKIEKGELEAIAGPDGKPLVESEGLVEKFAAITRESVDTPRPLRAASERTKARPAAPPPRRPTDEGEVPSLNDERARHEREKRLLAELARQEKERELLRRDDVELAWGQAVNITRSRLLGVPSAAKQRIPHLEIEEVELLTALIREALEELAAGEVKA